MYVVDLSNKTTLNYNQNILTHTQTKTRTLHCFIRQKQTEKVKKTKIYRKKKEEGTTTNHLV